MTSHLPDYFWGDLAATLAFGVMALVSLRGRPPAWSTSAMLRLHLDEPRSTGPRDRSSTVRRLARLLSR